MLKLFLCSWLLPATYHGYARRLDPGLRSHPNQSIRTFWAKTSTNLSIHNAVTGVSWPQVRRGKAVQRVAFWRWCIENSDTGAGWGATWRSWGATSVFTVFWYWLKGTSSIPPFAVSLPWEWGLTRGPICIDEVVIWGKVIGRYVVTVLCKEIQRIACDCVMRIKINAYCSHPHPLLGCYSFQGCVGIACG